MVVFEEILVYSPDEATHVQYLETIMELLKDHFKKCEFGVKEILYLGPIVSKYDMSKWPTP